MKTIVLILISFALISCGLNSTSQKESPSEIRDAQLLGAEYSVLNLQQVIADNCDGQNRVIKIGRSLSQEQTTSFQVEVGAGGLIKGALIPGAFEAELEAKIRAAIGKNIGVVYRQELAFDLETQPGTAFRHTVKWNETRVKGLIEIIYPSGLAKVGFEKLLGFELIGRTSEAASCNGVLPNLAPPLVQASLTQPATLIPTAPPAANVQIATLPTLTPVRIEPAATSVPTIFSDTKLLGEWVYGQPRAPMPPPAGTNQIIFAHGDIDNTGTCHVREFGPGEPIQGLGLGGFRLWLITGTGEYMRDVKAQLQRGAATHAGTDCPYLR